MIAGEACAGIGLLKQLALNSIEQSIVGAAERAALQREWERRWDAYLDWVVSQSTRQEMRAL